jgi:hypothetical protein
MPIGRNHSTTNRDVPTLFEDSLELIRTCARELGPSFGWEFLYCPSSLLSKRSRLWFIGINPGISPKETSVKIKPSFEDGNAYYVDRPWSPDGERLRNQVKQFFDELAGALQTKRLSGEALLNETLTANFCPFSSPTWRTLPERRKALHLSRELWRRILRQLSPRVIVCMGGIPYREFRRLYREMGYDIGKTESYCTGWGAVNFHLVECRQTGGSTMIVYLPHFSQIKLMLRENSLPHVKRLCLAIAESLRRP